jgi:hypothetical protein
MQSGNTQKAICLAQHKAEATITKCPQKLSLNQELKLV